MGDESVSRGGPDEAAGEQTIALDEAGVLELRRRFGDLHDSVLRRFSHAFGGRTSVGIEALDCSGTWHWLELVLDGVTEFRLAEGAAIWGNVDAYELSSTGADGSVTRSTATRGLRDLRCGSPTNQVLFAAAVHAVPEGVFVDLAPAELVDPAAVGDPAEWRKSTFYLFGRRGFARIASLASEHSPPSGDKASLRASLRAEHFPYVEVKTIARRDAFDAALLRCEEAGYEVHRIDASTFEVFQTQISAALRFRERFGYDRWTGNLNALSDAFGGSASESIRGLVFGFTGFARFEEAEPETARAVLEIVTRAGNRARYAGAELLSFVCRD